MRVADLSDYAGELRVSVRARRTDNLTNGPGSAEETVTDFPLAFTVPCAPTSSEIDGATCTVTTTADAAVPGFAPKRARAVYGLDRVEVFDGGPDEDADTTGDNSLFAVQGVFVP